MSPTEVQTMALAWIAVVGAIIAAVAPVVLQVIRNAKDIQAAWDMLHRHDTQLNGGDGTSHDKNTTS